jgi:hypothetical protein
MSCLNEAQIQSIVDGEAADAIRQHVATCAGCQTRVRDREQMMTAIGQAMNIPMNVPPGVSRRIQRALAEGSASGATHLRDDRVLRPSWRSAAWSAGAVVAATLIAILFVAPIVKGPGTVSAAEILSKSANRLAERATAGVEVLEYELALEGVPREMMPDHPDGVYHVKQVIDHDTAGRYLLATHASDGQLISSVAQDPVSRRRVVAIRLEDQPYRFEFGVQDGVALSLPEMERLHMQASVTMMQASGNQHLQVIDTPVGRQYRIQVPQVSSQTSSAVWDLSEAEVVIDATDYHLIEFAVKGTFLQQPYAVSYRLIAHSIDTQASAASVDVPHDPRAIVIQGEGSAIPARDVLVAALREYARITKQAR